MNKSVFARMRPAVPVLLVVTGLILIAVAGWVLHPALGLALGGVGCFVLEWRLDR